MAIAHLRTYTINKGQVDSWLKLFDEKLVPLLKEHGIKVEGKWVNDEGTQFIRVRSDGDTEAKEADPEAILPVSESVSSPSLIMRDAYSFLAQ